MSRENRILGFLLNMPFWLIAVAFVAWLVLSGGSSSQALLDSAEFVDRDEDGDVFHIEFYGEVPNADSLNALQDIRKLRIENAEVGPSFFSALDSLKSLAELSLVDCQFMVPDLSELNQSPQLKVLDFSRSRSMPGLQGLELPELRALRLNECESVNDLFVEQLAAFPALESLELRRTNVTDKCASHLQTMLRLKSLDVAQCPQVTEGFTAEVLNVANLQYLSMSGHGLTLAEIRKFQQQRPSVYFCIVLNELDDVKPLLTANPLLGGQSLSVHCEIKDLTIAGDVGHDYSIVEHFPDLVSLTFSGVRITELQTASLKTLRQLHSLTLKQSSITDAALKHMTDLPGVLDVVLSEVEVTTSVLQEVRKFSGLQFVEFQAVPLGGGMHRVTGLLPGYSGTLDLSAAEDRNLDLKIYHGKGFTAARLSRQSLQSTDFSVINSWSDLQDLNLSDTLFHGRSLQFTPNSRLRSLTLDRTDMTDSGVTSMKLPDSLESLSLAATQITGESLGCLADRLVSLDVSRTSLTQAGLLQAFALRPVRLALADVQLDGDCPSLDLTPRSDRRICSITLNADSSILTSVCEATGADGLMEVVVHNATGQHLRQLQALTGIFKITIVNGTFEQDSFVHLRQCPLLRSLHVRNCTLSEEARSEIAQLVLSLPGLQISYQY